MPARRVAVSKPLSMIFVPCSPSRSATRASCRWMLSEAESRELDRVWDELLFVSEAPLKQVDVFEQLFQFATQDAKPSAFEPMREPILQAAAKFKEQQK